MNMKTKKRKTEDEIDAECKKEAERFVHDLTDDVQIYKKIRKLDNFKQNINADNFVAWLIPFSKRSFRPVTVEAVENTSLAKREVISFRLPAEYMSTRKVLKLSFISFCSKQ